MRGIRSLEHSESSFSGAVVVQVEGYESDRRAYFAEKPLSSRCRNFTQNQLGAREPPLQSFRVHFVVPGSPDVRQISIVDRWGHACARIETYDIDPYTHLALDLRAHVFQSNEPTATSYSEFDYADARNLQARGQY